MINPTYESIDGAATTALAMLWAISWQFCVLGLVVLLIHCSLRRTAPNWRYWLWQILAIKLLLMPFWTAAAPWQASKMNRSVASRDDAKSDESNSEETILEREKSPESKSEASSSSEIERREEVELVREVSAEPLRQVPLPTGNASTMFIGSSSPPRSIAAQGRPSSIGQTQNSASKSAVSRRDTRPSSSFGPLIASNPLTNFNLKSDRSVSIQDQAVPVVAVRLPAAAIDVPTPQASVVNVEEQSEAERASTGGPEHSASAKAFDLNENARFAENTGLSWRVWLMLIWLTGVCWLSVRIVRQGVALNRGLRHSEPGGPGLNQRVRDAAARLGMTRIPEVRVIDLDVSPFVCGLWRPKLVVPSGLFESFSTEQLDLVLLHELAHVRRRDLIWGWIPEIGRILFFFHPLVYLVRHQIRFERELACDQLAMLSSGRDAATYADTLVRVVGEFSQSDSVRALSQN